jgi:hypothetical protein
MITASERPSPPDSRTRICALKYRPESRIESVDGKVILFAVKDGAGLNLYAHRGLRQQVAERDREYIEELLADMLHRSLDTPEELFQQLSNLTVGPLVADAVEWIELKAVGFASLQPEFLLCGDSA